MRPAHQRRRERAGIPRSADRVAAAAGGIEIWIRWRWPRTFVARPAEILAARAPRRDIDFFNRVPAHIAYEQRSGGLIVRRRSPAASGRIAKSVDPDLGSIARWVAIPIRIGCKSRPSFRIDSQNLSGHRIEILRAERAKVLVRVEQRRLEALRIVSPRVSKLVVTAFARGDKELAIRPKVQRIDRVRPAHWNALVRLRADEDRARAQIGDVAVASGGAGISNQSR